MPSNLDAVVLDLTAVAAAVGAEARADALKAVGLESKDDARKAIRGDLGDLDMRNWRRRNPIQLGARFDQSDTSVTVIPERRAAGPLQLLEEGRRAGMSKGRKGGRRAAGSAKGSARGVARPGRRVGRTAAKHTWSDAVKLMTDAAPERALKAIQAAVLKRWG